MRRLVRGRILLRHAGHVQCERSVGAFLGRDNFDAHTISGQFGNPDLRRGLRRRRDARSSRWRRGREPEGRGGKRLHTNRAGGRRNDNGSDDARNDRRVLNRDVGGHVVDQHREHGIDDIADKYPGSATSTSSGTTTSATSSTTSTTTSGLDAGQCRSTNDCAGGFELCVSPGGSSGCGGPACSLFNSTSCQTDADCRDAGAAWICGPAECGCRSPPAFWVVRKRRTVVKARHVPVVALVHQPCRRELPTVRLTFSALPGRRPARGRPVRRMRLAPRCAQEDYACQGFCVEKACYATPGRCQFPPE